MRVETRQNHLEHLQLCWLISKNSICRFKITVQLYLASNANTANIDSMEQFVWTFLLNMTEFICSISNHFSVLKQSYTVHCG